MTSSKQIRFVPRGRRGPARAPHRGPNYRADSPRPSLVTVVRVKGVSNEKGRQEPPAVRAGQGWHTGGSHPGRGAPRRAHAPRRPARPAPAPSCLGREPREGLGRPRTHSSVLCVFPAQACGGRGSRPCCSRDREEHSISVSAGSFQPKPFEFSPTLSRPIALGPGGGLVGGGRGCPWARAWGVL